MEFLRNLRLGHRVLWVVITLGSVSFLSFQTSGFRDGPILCTFRNFTGLQCPFCGTTRSIGSVLRGDFVSALELNPFGFLIITGFVFLILSPGRMASLNQKIATRWWALSQRGQISFVLFCMSLLWSLNMPRMI